MSLTCAIIQARLRSTSLPGKVLADIHGKPMIWWMLQRLYRCQTFSRIILATTTNTEDDRLVSWSGLVSRGRENSAAAFSVQNKLLGFFRSRKTGGNFMQDTEAFFIMALTTINCNAVINIMTNLILGRYKG